MTVELPDLGETSQLSAGELRLELACALFSRGRVGKAAGAQLAGVGLIEFQKALGDRRIESYPNLTLADEVAILDSFRLFQ